jgi:hypothetical protein
LRSKTIFQQTRKELIVWYTYVGLIFVGCSLRFIAQKLNINLKTAFYWRHKILNLLKNTTDVSSSGITESDETFFRPSYKGKKKGKSTNFINLATHILV